MTKNIKKIFKVFGVLSFLVLSSCSRIDSLVNVKQLVIVSNPNVMDYEVGESLSLNGLVVVDKTTRATVDDYESEPSEGYVFKENDAGAFRVTISKEDYKSTYLTLNVIAGAKTLEIQTMPTKTSYEVGESFSLDGLVVVDSTNRAIISDYTSSYQNGYQFTSVDVGTVTINISKSGYSNTSFQITVVNNVETVKYVDIYATNDMHGQIDADSNQVSIGRIMTYLKSEKETGNVLLLDQGDTWQGSIYSNQNHGALITDLMNYVHYDARTVGNHDFDWGTSYVEVNKNREYNGYSTPVLAANVYDFNFNTKKIGNIQQSSLGDKTVTYTLDNGLKVGIVGTIGKDQITSINSQFTHDIAFKDHIAVIKEEATKLRNAGCDIVISSTHCSQDDVLNNSLSDYVDLVLCGHSHQYEYTTEDGLLFAQFGCNNQYVGHIQISYDTTNGKVSYTTNEALDYNYINSEVSNVDTTISSIITEYKDACDQEAKQVVASNVSGNFYKNQHLPNLMCKAIYEQAVAEGYTIDLAYCNDARATFSYKSKWTYADLYEAFPFDNKIYIIEASANEMMNEVGKYNYVYRSSSFDGNIYSNRTYRIACLDYLCFHTNTSRYYDYFSNNNGNYVGILEDNYRVILKNYLIDSGYASGTLLSNSDFATSSSTRFSRSFNQMY